MYIWVSICMTVRLPSINVKEAKPFRSKLCVGPRMAPERFMDVHSKSFRFLSNLKNTTENKNK